MFLVPRFHPGNRAALDGAGGDVSFGSVVFLAGLEGADGATSYSEEKNSRAAVFNGNAQLDTAQFKFGTSSLLLDGTGDNITFLDNADWDLSNGNSDQFTIELFVRFNAIDSSHRGIIAQWGTIGNRSWALEVKSGDLDDLNFGYTVDGSTIIDTGTTSGGLTTATWYHLAVDKDSGGKIRIFIDGVMRGSATPADSSFFNSTTTLALGSGQGAAGLLNGWIDEVRITKGASRYGSDSSFTPPSVAFPRS